MLLKRPIQELVDHAALDRFLIKRLAELKNPRKPVETINYAREAGFLMSGISGTLIRRTSLDDRFHIEEQTLVEHPRLIPLLGLLPVADWLSEALTSIELQIEENEEADGSQSFHSLSLKATQNLLYDFRAFSTNQLASHVEDFGPAVARILPRAMSLTMLVNCVLFNEDSRQSTSTDARSLWEILTELITAYPRAFSLSELADNPFSYTPPPSIFYPIRENPLGIATPPTSRESTKSPDSGYNSARSECIQPTNPDTESWVQRYEAWTQPTSCFEQVWEILVQQLLRQLVPWLSSGTVTGVTGLFEKLQDNEAATIGELIRAAPIRFSTGVANILGTDLEEKIIDEGYFQMILERLKCTKRLPRSYKSVLERDELADGDFENFSPDDFDGASNEAPIIQISQISLQHAVSKMLSKAAQYSCTPDLVRVIREDTLAFLKFIKHDFLLSDERALVESYVYSDGTHDVLKRSLFRINKRNDRFKAEIASDIHCLVPVVPEPLSLIFAKSHTQAYGFVQKLFVMMYIAQSELEQVFICTSVFQLKSVHRLYAATMLNFVICLRCAFVCDVSRIFDQFVSTLKHADATNLALRTMYTDHKRMLQKLKHRLLQTSSHKPALHEMNRILRACAAFTASLREANENSATLCWQNFLQAAQLFCQVLEENKGGDGWEQQLLDIVDLTNQYR